MPLLEQGSNAHAAYMEIHGDALYKLQEFSPELKSKPKRSANINDFVRHQPRHDAESVYWILVEFIARAIPEDSVNNYPDNEEFKDFYITLLSNKIRSENDKRGGIIEALARGSMSILHPDMRGIGEFLRNISEIVLPEYEHVAAKLDEFHLHEAMQRLLLKEILDGKNISLKPGKRRVPTSNATNEPVDEQTKGTSKLTTASSSKRKANEELPGQTPQRARTDT